MHETLLIWAAAINYVDLLRLLLSAGASVQKSNSRGETALWVAAFHGFRDAVSILLKYGADVDAWSTDHATPIFVAAQQGHSEIVQLLKDHGCDLYHSKRTVFCCLTRRETPLQVAKKNHHLPCVTILTPKDKR